MRRRPQPGGAGDDRGAAVVEFVMVTVLLVMLLFAVLQVAVYLYERNVVASAVADAARYAATAGTDPSTGGDRASALIRRGLTAADAAALTCTAAPAVDASSGLAVVRVRCSGRARLLFLPLALALRLDVSSSALREASR